MRNPRWDDDQIELNWDVGRLFRIIVAALFSFALGIGIGLYIAWQAVPVEYINADPVDLRARYKEDYVRMISAAYVIDGDIAKAKRRLERLGLEISAKSFNERLIQEQQAGRDYMTLDALALLTQGLGYAAIPVMKPTPSADANSGTQLAPTSANFRLAERTMFTCTDESAQAQLQFIVRDTQGKGMPNIAIEIRWEGGGDTIYTGLKPERGIGYADFEATPGNYSASIPNTASDVVENLNIGDAPANCRTDRGATPRGWKIIFQQK